MPELREVVVGGDEDGWRRAGFTVRGDRIGLHGLALRIDPTSGRPLSAWGLTGLGEGDDVDGVPCVAPPGGTHEPDDHPNGITALDHVVVLTRDLEATTAAFAAVGVPRRRTREVPGAEPARRQAFFVLGTAVAEVVGPVDGSGDAGTARLWGLAFVAPDLDDTVAAMGRLAGPVRAAVQPGRRIATLHHRSARIPVPSVIMSPRA